MLLCGPGWETKTTNTTRNDRERWQLKNGDEIRRWCSRNNCSVQTLRHYILVWSTLLAHPLVWSWYRFVVVYILVCNTQIPDMRNTQTFLHKHVLPHNPLLQLGMTPGRNCSTFLTVKGGKIPNSIFDYTTDSTTSKPMHSSPHPIVKEMTGAR